MELLYITYIDFDNNPKSGSAVRPQKMYNAFVSNGTDLKLLCGQQNKRKERRKRVKEVLKWLDANRPDMCYIESPSGPIFNFVDLKLIIKLHKLGVPISYFLRDAFWLFPSWMKAGQLKNRIITVMNKVTLRVLKKNCDLVYFPTRSMAELFGFINFKSVDILPPAGDCHNFKNRNCDDLVYNAIYVGAVSEVNGTFELVKAFELLNSENFNIDLTIVARKPEWNSIKDKIGDKEKSWLKIIHASGKELNDIYANADVAIFPRQADEYIDMAMPVKAFEYLSFGKPIVCTMRTELKRFIELNNCGIICDDDYISIAEAVALFYKDSKLRGNLYANVMKTAQINTWSKRAEQVVDDLRKMM